MLDKIKSFFSTGGAYFTENASTLNYMNKNQNDFELNKATSGNNANKLIGSYAINNDIVASIVKAYKKGVVGTHIPIQSRSGDEEFDKEFEKQLRIWSKRGNCELTGRFYRGLAERELIGYNLVQGGFIIKHHYNKKWNIPYKFEIIPLSMIDRAKNNIIDNEINGLKINNYGELKGIYIYKDSLRGDSTLISSKHLTLFVVPFIDATQYSGISPLVPIISTLDLLSEYNMAELKSAKNKADGAIIIKTNLFNEILKIKQENAKRTTNGKVSEQELFDLYKHFKINGSLDGANYIPLQDEVENLQERVESVFEILDSTAKRTISSGAGLSTQTTIREESSSYNAALLSAKLDDEQFEIDFTDFIELVWREVIEVRLMDSLVLAGKINKPDYWSNTEEYRALEFIRKSSSHIDPTKVETAHETGLTAGTMNEIDILATKGKDWQTHIEKRIQYEIEYQKKREEAFKKAGLELPEEKLNQKDNQSDEKDNKNDSNKD